MDKDSIKKQVMDNVFTLLTEQGLLTKEEYHYLKVMLEGQSGQDKIYEKKSRHL